MKKPLKGTIGNQDMTVKQYKNTCNWCNVNSYLSNYSFGSVKKLYAVVAIFVFAVCLAGCMRWPDAGRYDFSSCKQGVFCSLLEDSTHYLETNWYELGVKSKKVFSLLDGSQIADLFINNGGSCVVRAENQEMNCLITVRWLLQSYDGYGYCMDGETRVKYDPPCRAREDIEYSIKLSGNNVTLVKVSASSRNKNNREK